MPMSTYEVTGVFMLILQYANGGNLREYLVKKQKDGIYKILWNEIIRIAIEITHGLKYLHNENIVHRDLHSMNILIHDGSALISDFGLSKKLRDSISTLSSGTKGMPAYIEPECLLQNVKKIKLDKKTDFYSLGALFWELTSGIPPFNGHENLAEFITNLVDDDSETSMCSGDFVLSNDSDRQSMLFENIYTLFKNTNTYDKELKQHIIVNNSENIIKFLGITEEQIVSGLQNLHDNNIIHGDLLQINC
ncbi:kinase-like domain-containing protein [Gigaspora rosea]|uniref:Kinase-like domain-containing protein n=1 Tax=Gigaspora rosea TaxID=44941 RepID=A0A397UAU8_9GLOM|nr:kinase-like domain-containing protein [Gigaspora rosea]